MNEEEKEKIRKEWQMLGYMPDLAEKVIKTCEKALTDKVATIRGAIEEVDIEQFGEKRRLLNQIKDYMLSLPSLSLPASREENEKGR